MPKYPFDEEFQCKLLGMMVENFGGICSLELIKSEFFEDPQDSKIASIILKFRAEYGLPPTWDILRQELVNAVDEEEMHLYQERYDQAKQHVATLEKKYVVKQARRFGFGQALRLSITEAINDLQRDEIEQAADKLIKGTQAGVYDEQQELRYFETVSIRLRKQKKEKSIHTLIPELDHVLRNRGLNYRELGIVLAPPGGGKTMFLTHMAKSAVLQKKSVIFISIDMIADLIAARLDASFSGVFTHELFDNRERVVRKVTEIGERYGELLIIKEYPEKTLTVAGLQSYLQHLADIDYYTDMVIVDYSALMSSGDTNFRQPHKDLGNIILGLRRLAKEMNLAIWTGAQGHRAAASAELVTAEHAAESFEMVNHANVMVSLSQTPEEKTKEKMRMYIAKNQTGQTNIQIPIHTNFRKGCFFRMT